MSDRALVIEFLRGQGDVREIRLMEAEPLSVAGLDRDLELRASFAELTRLSDATLEIYDLTDDDLGFVREGERVAHPGGCAI